MLSIIDDKCNTYTRVWCVLEIFHVLQTFGAQGAFDIYTAKPNCSAYDMSSFDAMKDAVGKDGFRGSAWLAEVYRRMPIVHDRPAVGLTFGPAECDKGEAASMTLRMQSFPIELIQAALDIRVQSSEATVPSDRAMILNYIAGRPDKDDQGQQIAPTGGLRGVREHELAAAWLLRRDGMEVDARAARPQQV